MQALRHLLAATDLSPPSLHALDRGFLLARDSGASYTAVHALGLAALAPLRPWLGGGVEESIGAAAGARLRERLGDPTRNHGVSATLRVEPGMAASTVLAVAEELPADLVLIGAQGSGLARHLLLASTAHRLLRQTRRPVLVVRQPALAPYRRAMVPVDFSPASALCLEAVARVAPGASLLLLHVLEVPFEQQLRAAGVDDAQIEDYRRATRDDALARLRDLAARAGRPDAQVLVLEGPAAPLLLEQAALQACDLVVMGKHGILVTEEVLLGSTTLRVLAETTVDVLVVVDERDPRPA